MSYKDDDAERDLTIQRMCVAHTCDGDNNYKEGIEQEAKPLQQKLKKSTYFECHGCKSESRQTSCATYINTGSLTSTLHCTGIWLPNLYQHWS